MARSAPRGLMVALALAATLLLTACSNDPKFSIADRDRGCAPGGGEHCVMLSASTLGDGGRYQVVSIMESATEVRVKVSWIGKLDPDSDVGFVVILSLRDDLGSRALYINDKLVEEQRR